MDASTALTRIKRFASQEALPLAQTGLAKMLELADDATIRVLGRDFEQRVRRIEEAEGKRDLFGFDLETAKYAAGVAAFFYRIYFRAECFGISKVPPGRVLLVSNHSGQVPLDALCLGAAMLLDAEPPRFIRSMVDKWTQTLPFVGTFFQRVGQVVGVPENCRLLLSKGEAIMVFPEGSKGISKPFDRRYQLSEFGLGFMRLALETQTPIVPIAVIGAEEQYINLSNLDRAAKLLRMPVFPLIPQWFIPGLQLPLPTKYRIYFGDPLHFEGDHDDEDAVIEDKVLVVKSAIQSLIDRGLRERESIFW